MKCEWCFPDKCKDVEKGKIFFSAKGPIFNPEKIKDCFIRKNVVGGIAPLKEIKGIR